MNSLVKRILGISLFATIHVCNAFAAEFVVNGLSKTMEKNVQYYLSPLSNIPAENLSVVRLQKLVDQALTPYGYYHSKLNVSIGEGEQVFLDIDTGPATFIASSIFTITGEAGEDQDFVYLFEASQLSEGHPLSHSKYDSFKQDVLALAQRKGYLEGQFLLSTLEVIPSMNQANVKLHFDSGKRYSFGDISVVNSSIEAERVESLSPFKKGDEFNSIKLGEYQSSLSQTNWFRNVIVKGNFDKKTSDNQIPIEVSTEPSPRNVVQVGGGYAADLGLRGVLKWTQPWYNSRGHSLDAEALVSKPEQSVMLSYKIPTRNVLSDYYGVQFETKRIDYRDTASFTNELTFEKHWQMDNDWQSTIHVSYLQENYKQASEVDQSQLLLPGITFSMLERKDDLLEIKHRHRYSLEYSDPYLLSDSRLLHIKGNSVLSWDISEKHKFHFRSNIGINIADSLSDLPSSLRFWAGGNDNLRGYGYESISPKDLSGQLTGAKYMFTAGFEYQYQLSQQIWLGAFYDIGDAFNNRVDWKRGTGVSFNWDSKYVPVKVDFAYGVDAPEGDEFRIHFSLGTQF